MARTIRGVTRTKILKFMRARIRAGMSPSIREVQDAFSFRSTATVREHLAALVAAGTLAQEPGRDRGFRLPGAKPPVLIPILGRVQAGPLTEALEDPLGYIPAESALIDQAFALRVSGESMRGREIHDGDTVLVYRNALIRHGDIVVARIGDEATLKTYQIRSGRVVLKAENPDFPDIIPVMDDLTFEILGRVFEVRRSL